MFLKGVVLLGVVALLPAFAQDATEKIARHQHGPIRDRQDHGDGTSNSSNWSGYAVTGTSFTSAKGSWTVPTAHCSGVAKDQYAAFWVGLDGFLQTSDSVEQTGTDSDCDRTSPSYYAWYEFYPQPSFEITSVPVAPGNQMFAEVTYNGSQFTITITNETTGKTFTKTARVSGAARSSAEWIAEAPCCTAGGGILPLSDFGTILFGDDSTGISGTNDATDSSNSGDIGSFPAAGINKINKTGSSSSPQTSTCTSLSSDGTSFSCTWAN
ncbi:MAG: G1 family glutamic endopeptidase [Bryobacteraceae bacterium]